MAAPDRPAPALARRFAARVRPLAIALLMTTPALLVGGSHAASRIAPEAAPYRLLGPGFFGLLIACGGLALRGWWAAALALVLAYDVVVVAVTAQKVARWPAVAMAVVITAVAVLVLFADDPDTDEGAGS